MLNWLKNLTRSKPIRSAFGGKSLRVLRGGYDAAVTSDDNRRHWTNADGLSADAANSSDVRRILRNRARYEIANNSYAKGIVLTLANDVIGTGPRLQMLTEDAEANRRIERVFALWSKAVSLAGKLRTMRMAHTGDGESFVVLINNEHLATGIKLDLRLIEADQVTTPDLGFSVESTDNAVDGIVFDVAGL